MDGNGKKPRGGGGKNKAAARSVAATQAVTTLMQQQPARAALESTPAFSDDKATAAQKQVDDDGQPDVASVDESRGGGGCGEEVEDNRDDDVDDEQVERFYALLANIRAMRGLLPLHKQHNMVDRGDTHVDDSARTTKRLRRRAEPPWRPVFRMEDFEEPPPPPPPASSTTTCKIMKPTTRGAGHDDHSGHAESSGGSARPSVDVVASSMPHAAARFQQSDSSS